MEFSCSSAFYNILKSSPATSIISMKTTKKSVHRGAVDMFLHHRSHPYEVTETFNKIIMSDFGYLHESKILPDWWWCAALDVSIITGYPSRGYRYILSGESGRITLVYNYFKKCCNLRAVVARSVTRPERYKFLCNAAEEFVMPELTVRSRELFEHVQERRLFMVDRWCLTFLPTANE